MKYLRMLTIMSLATAFLYLTFPQTAHASANQGNGITLPQFLVLALVMGWYAYNHFKDKIKALFKNSFSSRKEGDR
ncbi:MAG: hypothetical protein JRC53_04270 [Deltaproteobacteria bacterium]|nr:hypothetical protein [Deltaproteobacteria bacterium]MBW2649023.1 hypothetical protein [Deltaproteobacteria bacterium]